MNRGATSRLPWLPLFAMACFACSTFLKAQQTSDVHGSDLTSAAELMRAASLYPTESSGTGRESVAGAASPMRSKSLDQAGTLVTRSAWMAGANSMGRANTGMWNAPEASFRGEGASSWNAGVGNFSLDRQQSGVWRELPGKEVQPNTLLTTSNSLQTTSVESSALFSPPGLTSDVLPSDLFSPAGLTSKGAALVKGSRLPSSLLAHRAKALGARGFAARRAGTPFGTHAPKSNSLGRGLGFSSTQHTQPSTGISGSSLPESPNLDQNPPLLEPPDSGAGSGEGDASH